MIIDDILVCQRRPDRHGKPHLDHVALTPLSVDPDEASLCLDSDGLVIDFDTHLLLALVHVGVQIPRHGLIPRPAGNTKVDCKPLGVLWIHFYLCLGMRCWDSGCAFSPNSLSKERMPKSSASKAPSTCQRPLVGSQGSSDSSFSSLGHGSCSSFWYQNPRLEKYPRPVFGHSLIQGQCSISNVKDFLNGIGSVM